LGSETSARRIEIRWPSGAKQILENVSADRVIQAPEPAAR